MRMGKIMGTILAYSMEGGMRLISGAFWLGWRSLPVHHSTRLNLTSRSIAFYDFPRGQNRNY